MSAGQAGIIFEPELLKATQFERRGDLERWLLKAKVPYFRGKAGALFTTIRLLESTKLPQSSSEAPPADPPVEF